MLLDVDINTKALKEIKKNIQQYSPHPHKVKIVAVTKKHSFIALQSAEKNRLFDIGENRVQETEEKIKNHKMHSKTQLHLIGHLQTNKASLAVRLYNIIQSVDSIRLLHKINQSAEKQKKKQIVFLQVNITKTPTQQGFTKEEIMAAAQKTTQLNYINMKGIMSIGAHTSNQLTIKKNFESARKIQKIIEKKINPNCSFLSLGMSQDYILALQAGATHIRLGTILFNKNHGN